MSCLADRMADNRGLCAVTNNKIDFVVNSLNCLTSEVYGDSHGLLISSILKYEIPSTAERNKLKALKWKAQQGLCSLCGKPVEQKNSELDRIEAFLGYTDGNVRLLHHECHVRDQARKGYA